MTEYEIAFVAYEANRALCIAFGNHELATWDMAAPRHKMEMIYAVLWLVRNPLAGPADFHAYRLHAARSGDAESVPPAERLERVEGDPIYSELSPLQRNAFRLTVNTVRCLQELYDRSHGFELRTQAALAEAFEMQAKTTGNKVLVGTVGGQGAPHGPLAPPEDDDGHGLLEHQRP